MEKLRRRPDLSVRNVDGEIVVLDAANGLMHVLKNPCAVLIFEDLDGERTVEDIFRHVAETFEIPLEDSERDVRAFLTELQEQELLVHTIWESTLP